VRDLELHPITQLFRQGVPVTINTDDPLVSNITLSDELFRAVKYMSLSLEDVKALMLTAVKSSFLPSAERQALVDQFRMWLETPAAVK
jgi:adenosine deaminase